MRALIATPIGDRFMTALCKTGGEPEDLGRELRKYHIFPGAVYDLVVSKSFSALLGSHRLKDITLSADDSVKILKNGRIMIRRPGDGEEDNIISFPELMKKDVDFVYIFRNGNWDVIRKESGCR